MIDPASIDVRALRGEALEAALDDVARLRIAVFRKWPYLYDGTLEYERNYLTTYRDNPGALLIGPPGVTKSHAAKALALSAVQRGFKVLYREAHTLIEEIHLARELGEIKKYRSQLQAAEVLIIDDLFLRRLPQSAGEELADVLMSRYEKLSTIVTSNRPVEDWATLLGDVVIVTPLLDRLMHHGHLLKFEGKSWRLKESAARLARQHVDA